MIYYEKFEMTWTANRNSLLQLKINWNNENSSEEYVVYFTLERLINALWWAEKINHTKKILTDKDKHHMLHLALSWDEEIFYNLTSAEKLRIIDALFKWEEERLIGLTNAKKLSLLEELFTWKKEKVLLTDTEKDDILLTLFWEKEWELDSSFLYKWKWAELYDQISNDDEYPFMKTEMDCLSRLIYHPKFKKKLKKTENVCDNWAWNGDKALSLFKHSYWDGTYFPEDFSREMLDIAERKIKDAIEKYPGMRHMKIWNPQKLNSNKHLTSGLKNNMYLFLWGTICNMSDKEIVDVLKSMDNKWTLKWNTILISYFTAPKTEEEIQQLINIYHSENNRKFHENWMGMLWLSKDEFEFITVYKKDDENQKVGPFPWRIEWRIRAKKNAIINLSNWKTIEVKAGQEFILHYSRRFSDEKIKSLFEEGGCSINLSIADNKDGIINRDWVSMALLERKPTKRKSLVNKVWACILAVLLAWWAYSLWKYDKSQKDDIKKENNLKRQLEINHNSIDHSKESQETKELITALSLDKLDKKTRTAIIIQFNTYVQTLKKEHKTDWMSTEELIYQYRVEFWETLIKTYNIDPPYNFMTLKLIKNSSHSSELPQWTVGKNFERYNVHHYDIFKYKSMWRKYIILKAFINNTRIYLASNYIEEDTPLQVTLSTDNMKVIQDKSGLDDAIIANNNNLNKNLITGWISRFWEKIWWGSWLIIIEDYIDDETTPFEKEDIHEMYLNWEKYYIKITKTADWTEVWLASKSPEWPFTIAEFNKIANIFIMERGWYRWAYGANNNYNN